MTSLRQKVERAVRQALDDADREKCPWCGGLNCWENEIDILKCNKTRMVVPDDTRPQFVVDAVMKVIERTSRGSNTHEAFREGVKRQVERMLSSDDASSAGEA